MPVVAKEQKDGRYLVLPNPRNGGKIDWVSPTKREDATKFKNTSEAKLHIQSWPELSYFKWEYETV